MSAEYTREEVAKHNKPGDVWLIVDTAVYNVSKFADLHPGGAGILHDKDVAGQDTTDAFFGLHVSEVLNKYKRLKIGTIKGEKPQWILPTPGALSVVPFGEPMWLTKGYKSPYFNESHYALQKFMRNFVDKEIIPEARASEKTDERPSDELFQKMSDQLIHHMRLGPGPWLHGLTLPGGLKGEDFTYMHEMVLNQELARTGARGFADGMWSGSVIGLPPVCNFGSKAIRDRVVPEVLSGKAHIALAISEPFAGGDVAGIKTTATKTADGKHWIVTGQKKWITGGHWSKYFATACKTGPKELTMILVERTDDLDTKVISTSYSKSAGTSLVTYDDVKVPVENTLGKEGQGLMVVLSNFNHERWVMICASVRSSRLFLEQTFIWAHVRKVFGKRLIDQPVIRQKFATAFAQVEAAQALLENLTYQMTHMSYKEQSDLLAGQIGLLKAYSTRVAYHCADVCVQIFGGRGLTKTGMGSLVEGFSRTNRFDSILGGSEDILFDLGVRQAMRKMPKVAL